MNKACTTALLTLATGLPSAGDDVPAVAPTEQGRTILSHQITLPDPPTALATEPFTQTFRLVSS